jgi:hypothetical protein
VTSTVRDLVAGSGLVFQPRGEYELRGAGTWTLFAANDSSSVGTPQPALAYDPAHDGYQAR